MCMDGRCSHSLSSCMYVQSMRQQQDFTILGGHRGYMNNEMEVGGSRGVWRISMDKMINMLWSSYGGVGTVSIMQRSEKAKH